MEKDIAEEVEFLPMALKAQMKPEMMALQLQHEQV